MLVLIGITKLTTAWIKTTHYVPIHPETVSRVLKKVCIQYIVACPWRECRNRTQQTTVELSTEVGLSGFKRVETFVVCKTYQVANSLHFQKI